MVSLDLSAAFDPIDYDILLYCLLESVFGIAGTCLNWFKSYLSGRRLRVVIDGTASDVRDLKFGVPQGSVLGPKLFTMYLQPLGEIARKHNVMIHIYANDCQLYILFKKGNCFLAKTQLESLLANKIIRHWMLVNKVKLNDDKTEVIALSGPRRSLDVSQLSPVSIGD